MRKPAALFLVAIFIAAAAHAQNEGRAVRFGIKLAPNMAYIKPDIKDYESGGSIIGYTFGLMGDFIIGANGQYAFASGVLLNNIGGKYTAPVALLNGDTKDLESELKLRYIEVPVTMKLKTSEIGYMTYYGQVGVSTAFNIRAKADIEIPDLVNGGTSTLEDEDVSDDVALFKAALVIGAGLEYNFSGNTSLLVGVTYNGGFTNLYDGMEYTDADGNKQDVKVLASYIELTTGVFF